MRKELDVTISPETAPSLDGRDYGKVFHVTEMSAVKAEKWANRATLALVPRLSQEVAPDVAEALAENPTMPQMGQLFRLLQGISFPEIEPLLDELMECVTVVSDASGRLKPRQLGLGGMEDIEEIETIRYLREVVLNLHTSFIMPASILSLMEAVSRVSVFSATPTSPSTLGSSSPAPRP